MKNPNTILKLIKKAKKEHKKGLINCSEDEYVASIIHYYIQDELEHMITKFTDSLGEE